MQMRSQACLYRIVLPILLSLFLSPVFAQTIRGKVFDSHTGEPLIGANVTLQNTRYTTSVQLDGTFAFKHIPTGKYSVVVSTIGYQSSKPVEVDVTPAGQSTDIRITMEQSAITLEEAQISAASAGSDRLARRLEQRADMVQNILSARTIEISPDVTVANALQRVSGVVIQRDNTGEGRYAIIRGMEQRYNNTLVNGIKIPSPDDKYRFVPMDIFPADMVERLEVVKALTPSMEGDAIGGTMNLVMKNAPDRFIFTANAAGGYNTIFSSGRPFTSFSTSGINKKSPAEIHGNSYFANANTDFPTSMFNYTNSHPVNTQFGMTIGDRFLDKKLGVILSASYQDFYKGSTWDRLVPDAQPYPQPTANTPNFSDAYIRQYNTQTSRFGLQNKIDYVFNSRNKLSLFNMFLHQVDKEVRYTPDTTVGLNSSPTQATVSKEYRSTWTIQNIYNATLQGDHQLGSRWKLNWSGVYSIAKKELPDQSWYHYDAYVDYNGKNTSETDTVQIGKGLMDAVWQHNKDQDLAGYGNLAYTPKLFHRDVEFTVGGLYRYKTRDNYYADYSLQDSTGGYWSSIAGQVKYFSPQQDAQGSYIAENADFYTAHEKIGAGYIQTKFMLLPALQVLGGVRVENTHQDYTTALSLQANAAYGSIHYTDVLPSIHLKYLLASNSNLRLSYFKSISRPGFGEVVPTIYPQGEQYTELGNPQLKHVRADNLDLRYELFPGLTDQLLIGAFYKRLQNPIEYFVVRDASPSALYVKPQNADQATNFGAEIVFTKYFGKFGISANYTYTHSRITTPKLVYAYVQNGSYSSDSTYATNQSRPLQGQADHVGNLSLLYKDPVLGLDVQLAFSYIGSRIVQVSQYYNLDIWQKPIGQLDLSLEKRIVRRLNFFGKVNNLTDSKPKQYLKVPYGVVDNNFNGHGGYQIPFQTGSSYTTVQQNIYRLNFLAGFRYKF